MDLLPTFVSSLVGSTVYSGMSFRTRWLCFVDGSDIDKVECLYIGLLKMMVVVTERAHVLQWSTFMQMQRVRVFLKQHSGQYTIHVQALFSNAMATFSLIFFFMHRNMHFWVQLNVYCRI